MSHKEAIKNIIQSTSRDRVLESAETLRSADGSVVKKKALVDFLTIFGEDIYDNIGNTLSESEASSTVVSKAYKYVLACFKIRKIELTAMTEQLIKQGLLDNRFKYYADGKIQINANKKQEFLLLEVSSALGQATQGETAFNHTKVMFGIFAILRSLTCNYSRGSFESFEKKIPPNIL